MIRHALRYLAAPMLGAAGLALLRAALEESDRADTAESNLDIERGRLAECRRYLHEAATFANTCEAAANEDAQRVFDLSKEVDRLREVERNGLADDDVYQHTAATLQDRTRERDELRTSLGRAEIRIGQLERERDELRRRLDARVAEHADK